MTALLDQYLHLLNLTQTHLLSEFAKGSNLQTDPLTHAFFKDSHSKLQEHPIEIKHQVKPQQTAVVQPKIVTDTVTESKLHQTPPPTPIPERTVPCSNQKTVRPPEQQKTPVTTSPSSHDGHFSFKLEPVTEIEKVDVSSFKREIQELFPKMQLIEEPPDDTIAKKISQQWKQRSTSPEVIILSFREPADQQTFLHKVKTAINDKLGTCVIYSAHTIEEKNAWDKLFALKSLKLMISTDYGMYSMPNLMKYHQESPEKSKRYLGRVPLLTLADLSLYLKQPQLKSALWQALCTMLPTDK